MFGYSRNSGIPFLRSYNEALARFESTKPIKSKGKNNGLVPLGNRGSTYYSIEKWKNDSIACCYSGEPTVIFNPDNTVMIRDNKYSTISAGYFVADILPRVNAYQKNYTLTVWSNGKEYQVPRNEGVLFKFVEGGIEPANPVKNVVHHVVRRELTNVRNMYAGFRVYLNGATKLREGAFADEEFKNAFGEAEMFWEYEGERHSRGMQIQFPNLMLKDVDQLLAMIDSNDPVTLNKAVLALASEAGTRHYRLQTWKVSTEQMNKKFDEYLMYKHRDVVFKEVEVPEGKVRKDQWAHMFK